MGLGYSDFSRLRVLFLVSAFNGLSQRIWCDLALQFQATTLHIGINPERIHRWKPDLILCPFQQNYIPDFIWQNFPCLILHPGPTDDGGPSSLNWAVLEGQKTWGVTILEAAKGWDHGTIWASQCFDLPERSVASIYRREVSDLALQLFPQAIRNFLNDLPPIPKPEIHYRKQIQQNSLKFAWEECTASILRKIRAGDSQPGTLGTIGGIELHLFHATAVEAGGIPGEVLSSTSEGIVVATGDGAILIKRIAKPGGIKLRVEEVVKGGFNR